MWSLNESVLLCVVFQGENGAWHIVKPILQRFAKNDALPLGGVGLRCLQLQLESQLILTMAKTRHLHRKQRGCSAHVLKVEQLVGPQTQVTLESVGCQPHLSAPTLFGALFHFPLHEVVRCFVQGPI